MHKVHRGIAMIELIFAIVVMAIVLMSAPTLINQSTRSSYVGLQQEAINAAATDLNLMMTKEWDAGNTNLQLDPTVLAVSQGHGDLNFDPITQLRIGTPKSSYRVAVTRGSSIVNAVLPNRFGENRDVTSNDTFDDVDDYDGTKAVLSVPSDSSVSSSANYIDKKIYIERNVAYVSDTPSSGGYGDATSLTFDSPFVSENQANSTNIKAINVTLKTDQTDEALQKEITLAAFICNIGHYKLEAKDIP